MTNHSAAAVLKNLCPQLVNKGEYANKNFYLSVVSSGC